MLKRMRKGLCFVLVCVMLLTSVQGVALTAEPYDLPTFSEEEVTARPEAEDATLTEETLFNTELLIETLLGEDTFFYLEPCEQIVSEATLYDNFEGDAVVVVLNRAVSRDNRKFTTSDFGDIGAIYVEDLDRLSNRENSYAQPLWDTESRVYALEYVLQYSLETENIHSRMHDTLYLELQETVEQYETLREAGEENTLVNFDEYRRILLIRLEQNCKENVLYVIQQLQYHDYVHVAQPNYIFEPIEIQDDLLATELGYIFGPNAITPNDLYLAGQWAVDKLSLPQAWSITTGCPTVRVGIIGHGIDANHPQLYGRVSALPCGRLTEVNTGSINPNEPRLGFGTAQAGIIGARRNNGEGIAGIAWDVQMVSVGVGVDSISPGCAQTHIDGITNARNAGIPILTRSWYGANNISVSVQNYTGLFINAAGNNGADMDGAPYLPGVPHAIIVGASDSNDARAHFRNGSSNYGANSVHLFAPGLNILTISSDDPLVSYSGTSAAAPHVAGVAALVLSVNPELTPRQVREVILASVDPALALVAYPSISGGRLNAYRAVQLAGETDIMPTRRIEFNANYYVTLSTGYTFLAARITQHNATTNTSAEQVGSVGFGGVRTGSAENARYNQMIGASGIVPDNNDHHVFSNLRDGRLEASGGSAYGPAENRYWLVSQTQATSIFGGWFNSQENANAHTSQEGRISPTDQVPEGREALVAFARWYPTRTVTFNPQGGTWPDGADVTTGNLTRRVVTVATPSNSVLGARTLHYGQVLDSDNRVLAGVSVEHHDRAAVGAPTREGDAFNGWWTAPTGGTRVTDLTDLPSENVTLHAQWVAEVPMHTITLYAGPNGTWGAVPTDWTPGSDATYITRTVAAGTPWVTIVFPEPTAVGAFGHTGWAPERPTGNIEADFTSTAQWGVMHRITLYLGHGTSWGFSPGWIVINPGNVLVRYVPDGTPWRTIVFPVLTRDGYTFMGWEPQIPTTDYIRANFTLTAQWEVRPATRTITLHAGTNGTWGPDLADWTAGSDATYITRTVADGTPWNTIVFPEPTPVGAFWHTGWAPERPTGNIDADFTSTAQWGVMHRITLYLGHGTSWGFPPTSALGGWTTDGGGTIVRYVPDGTPWNTIVFPALVTRPVRDGYAFMGWEPPIPRTGYIRADFTSTAQWAAVLPTTRQVRFNDNFSGRNLLIRYNTATNVRVQDDASVLFSTVSTGAGADSLFDQVIGAMGTLPTHSSHVFSNLRDGRLEASGNTAQGPTANRYWMVSQTQASSVFGGWFSSRAHANAHTSQGGRISPTDQVPAGTGALDIFARWYPTRTVTFNPQGGIWSSGAGGNLTRRAVSIATPGDSVLGARTPHYGQVLDSDNQVLSGVAMEHQNMGAMGAPTRVGYTFNGWWTARTGGVRVTDTTALPSGNVTLHAQWVAHSRQVRFNDNFSGRNLLIRYNAATNARVQDDVSVLFSTVSAGAGADSLFDQVIGAMGALPTHSSHVFSNLRDGRLEVSGNTAQGPTANRYWMVSQTQASSVFGGWFSSRAHANAHTSQGGRISPTDQVPAGTGALDIFARWYPTRTVTFNPQGGIWSSGAGGNLTRRAVSIATPGDSVLGARTPHYGQVLDSDHQVLSGVAMEHQNMGAMGAPTRVGYTFNGWWTARTGGVRVTDATALPSGNVTLHAQWISHSRQVRFNDNFSGRNLLIRYNAATNARVQDDASVLFGTVIAGAGADSLFDQVIGAMGTLPTHSSHVFSNLRDGRLEASGNTAQGPTANRYWMVSQTQASSVFGGWFSSRAHANAHTSQGGRISPTDQVPAGTGALDIFARWYPTRTVTFNPQGGIWSSGASGNLTRRAVSIATPGDSVLGARTPHYGQVLDSDNQVLSGVAMEHQNMGAMGAPTRVGYTFNGWWTARTGGVRITDATALPSGNVTLHAQWIR